MRSNTIDHGTLIERTGGSWWAGLRRRRSAALPEGGAVLRLVRTSRTQGDLDAADAYGDDRADLQQIQPDGAGASAAESGPGQRRTLALTLGRLLPQQRHGIELTIPPSKATTTRRRSIPENCGCSALHCVGIGQVRNPG